MHFWRGRGVYLIEECNILVSIHRVKKKSPDFCSNWLAVVYIGDKNGQVVSSLKSQTCLIHSNHGQHNFSVMIHEQSCHYLFSELTAFVFACSGATVMLAAVIFWVYNVLIQVDTVTVALEGVLQLGQLLENPSLLGIPPQEATLNEAIKVHKSFTGATRVCCWRIRRAGWCRWTACPPATVTLKHYTRTRQCYMQT